MKKNEKKSIKKLLNKEIKIVMGTLFVVLTIALGVYGLTNRSEDIVTRAQDAPINLVRDFNHKKGPDSAKVKIVEFYDPECESCAAFFPYIKEIVKSHPNDIQLIVRYALYHGNSLLAAKASDAAALQGKFWDYQELIFLNQPQWSHSQAPATESLINYAKDLSLNIDKFKEDMNDLKRMQTISVDLEDGPKLGVNGTPTIFINGKKIENINPENFKLIVESELAK